jgi:hypothetical protein
MLTQEEVFKRLVREVQALDQPRYRYADLESLPPGVLLRLLCHSIVRKLKNFLKRSV